MKEPYTPTDMTYSEWFSARAILKKNEGGRYGDVFGDYIARKILLQQIYPSEKNHIRARKDSSASAQVPQRN
jgi:hypothetical protein